MLIENLDVSELKGSRVLITGATGMIGSAVTTFLDSLELGIQITLPVRSEEKATKIFKGNVCNLTIIECDVLQYLSELSSPYDYIIHCACPTWGHHISQYPVETYNFTYQSILKILEYARYKEVKGIVYVSSIEYYGEVTTDKVITEDFQGQIDMASSRSSYPMGKRAAEFLCAFYALEYNIPVKIARPTQTFGAGVGYSEKRVFAQFARSIIQNEDIILHTDGESSKPYCYIADCVQALIFILLKGEKGEAYNIANDETYISIFDLAHYLRAHFNSKIQVRIEPHPEMGYAPVTKLRLSSQKLRKLGWKPRYGLYEMFEALIESMRSQYNNRGND